MTGGLDVQQSRHRGRSGTDTNSYRNQSWEKDAEFSNVGLFSELTWRASERGRLIGGARVDRASAKDFRPTSGHMMMMPNPTAGERRDSTLPSGFLRYEQDLESLPATWYVGLGHVQRFPDYWELFSPGRAGRLGQRLRRDQARKDHAAGCGHAVPRRQGRRWVSGYAGYVRDFILFDYRPGGMMGPTSQASNVNARIAGGELGASWKVAPSWTLGATLAYAWGENRSDGRALPQIPPLEAKLSAAYDDGVWSAGALWRLVAPQKRYALNSGNVVGQDFGPSAGFGVFSLNAGYAISKQVKLSLGVDNLFDKAYAEHLNLAGDAGFGFPGHSRVNEPGRSVWARVSVKY